MTTLAVRDLLVTLRRQRVVDRVTFDLAPGEFVGVIGPNGAGKSSLLKALAGVLPSTGQIVCDGAPFGSARQRAKLIAYLPQDRDVAWPLTVRAIVALGRIPHGIGQTLSSGDEEIINRSMHQSDVDGLAERRVTELSGGERCRVLIARALAQDTPILLADEPAAGLDLAHQLALMDTLKTRSAHGRSVLATMHDLDLAARYCTRLLLLHHGKLIADGPATSVLTEERLADVYGVRANVTHDERGVHIAKIELARPLGPDET